MEKSYCVVPWREHDKREKKTQLWIWTHKKYRYSSSASFRCFAFNKCQPDSAPDSLLGKYIQDNTIPSHSVKDIDIDRDRHTQNITLHWKVARELKQEDGKNYSGIFGGFHNKDVLPVLVSSRA